MERGRTERYGAQAPEKPVRRGYARLNPAYVNAAALHLIESGVGGELARGLKVHLEPLLAKMEEPRFLEASVEFLVAQNILDLSDSNRISATRSSQRLFDTPSRKILGLAINAHEQIIAILEDVLGYDKERKREFSEPSELSILETWDIDAIPQAFLEMLILPAVTMLHEMPYQRQTVASNLLEGHTFNLEALVKAKTEEEKRHICFFVAVLKKQGLLSGEHPEFSLTAEGKEVFKTASFAELMTSYYVMMQHLDLLTRGQKHYGLGADIFRHGRLNAQGSNGMTEKKVAPHISRSFSENGFLQERLARGGAYIDYGSGGGEMLLRIAQDHTRQKVQHLVGIDINPRSIKAAQEKLEKARLGSRVELVHGSIFDDETMRGVAENLQRQGLRDKVVASINAILHDIGPEASIEFLKLHAEHFGDAPLSITEIPRTPLAVVRKHPDRHIAAFQYIHRASGQHLYEERELEELLARCSYRILSKQAHGSVPGDDEKRMNTSVTWVAQHYEEAV